MKVRLFRLMNDQFKESFDALRKNKGIKGTISFKLLGTSKTINEVLMTYDETRKSLCEKFCVKDESGNPVLSLNAKTGLQEYDFDLQGRIDFQREHFDLLNEEVEIAEPKICFKDIEHLNLSVEELELFDGVVLKLQEENVE